MIRKVEAILDEQVRPALAAHGGNIEVVDIDNNKLFIKLQGGCQGCSSSTTTVKDGIQRLIQSKFPDITEVVDLTDHESGDNPFMQPIRNSKKVVKLSAFPRLAQLPYD